MPWPGLQRLLVSDGIGDLIELSRALAAAAGLPSDDVDYCQQKLELPREVLDPPPLITGDDLIAHGIPRGKHYQDLLERVRDAQLEAQVSTKAEALRLAEQLYRSGDAK